ncbi:zinc-finger protein [Saitozyma podzolica]|uniref:Zinc-finger protein n=1 Tax=Saitozyma podzolica TaxID=1890683 RepID=A0A427YUK9_9TREE|nr:zinc-finger protein [Saitozyma podzolica]
MQTGPHLSHAQPWAHDFICCDSPHHASTSHSGFSVSSARPGSTASTPATTPFVPTPTPTPSLMYPPQPAQAHQTSLPSHHSHAASLPSTTDLCDLDAFCCTDALCDVSCPSDECGDQCCADPSCPTDGEDALVKWACSKEGCHAIQQYLDCCTLPGCEQPTVPTAHQTMSNQHQASWPGTAPTAPPAPIPSHVCHWQNCHLVFHTMPDLLAHVAADHLGATGFASAAPTQQVYQPPAQVPMFSQQTVSGFESLLPLQTQTQAQLQTQTQTQTQPQTHTPVQSQTQTPVSVPSAGMQFPNLGLGLGLGFDQNQLLSCLWDDCLPLPMECSAEPNEPCPHPTQAHQHVPIDPHAHSHTPSEPFSPQTMLRHVLQEHLGVPGEILGWSADDPVPFATSHAAVTKAHDSMHHHHHHALPTPPCSVTIPTPSPPPTKPLVCQWPGCTHSDAFSDPGSLMEHLADVHVGRGKDSYTCMWGECGAGPGRVFKSRQKVLRHLQSHTGHRPFVCEICDQAFSEAAPLAAHLRRHAHDKPFVCDHPGCGKRFAISSSLTIHMRTHNGEKPFVCPHCGKGFVEASNLTKHIRTHTGERPFACAYPGCGKRFPRPDQLKRHMGVHEKGKAAR